jgi:uncharacterized protein YbjT (DUF2867 family)
MRIAVIGGTGVAGRAAAAEAARRGHEVRVVGRRPPTDPLPGTEFARADATTGEGLDDALRDVAAVVDCANVMSQSERTATDFFVAVTRHLLPAEAAAGVTRHVVLSIVGIDDVPLGYYRAKLAHERAAREGSVPVTVVRATQFHDFPRQVLERTALGPLALMPRIPVQPVSTADVAAVLIDAAEFAGDAAAPDLLQVGGPERHDLVELARRTLKAQDRHVMVLPLPVPGRTGRAMRSGGLLLKDGREGVERFDDWLAAAAR